MLEHLDDPVTVDDLARRAAMSPRTFARRFVAETGTTPHQWITDQRVLRAGRLSRTPTCPSRPSPATPGSARRAAAPPLHALHRHPPTAFRTQHRQPA